MKNLVAAHRKYRAANRNLAHAIKDQFTVGDVASHNKGCKPGNWIRVQVEMVSASGVKVWNPETGKTQWVHYWHFLPMGER